jgi:hypothetical protein
MLRSWALDRRPGPAQPPTPVCRTVAPAPPTSRSTLCRRLPPPLFLNPDAPPRAPAPTTPTSLGCDVRDTTGDPLLARSPQRSAVVWSAVYSRPTRHSYAWSEKRKRVTTVGRGRLLGPPHRPGHTLRMWPSQRDPATFTGCAVAPDTNPTRRASATRVTRQPAVTPPPADVARPGSHRDHRRHQPARWIATPSEASLTSWRTSGSTSRVSAGRRKPGMPGPNRPPAETG